MSLMRKLTQALALSAVACSTFASTTPAFAARSAALDGVNSSTILNSSAVANGNSTDGYASGKSQAGVAFEEGNLYLYGKPTFDFGSHGLFSDNVWDLVPSGAANSSGAITNSNDFKANSIGVGDFRSSAARGWSLNVKVSEFEDIDDPTKVQPVRSMAFNHATLMEGKFNAPIDQNAIDNAAFDLVPSTGQYGEPNNLLGNTSSNSILIKPTGKYGDPSNNGPGSIIWGADPGVPNSAQHPIQGKSVWALSFLKRGDIQLIPVNRSDQIPGHFKAQVTWTLSTMPLP
ncbi:hypothetical protein DS832_00265 [Bombilactobacillus bombi]|uniref:WxL domain-containing protein n=2 Tax=Bombilactobacillus bombi TaxID=1303590 RepID=A0A417ZDB2_9LACO|nr:hypothetical protein DS832_00265 [Bombilactobacillus bombi]